MTDAPFVATSDVVKALDAQTPCSLFNLMMLENTSTHFDSLMTWLCKNCPNHLEVSDVYVTLVNTTVQYSMHGAEPVLVDLPLPIAEDSVPQDSAPQDPLSSFEFDEAASSYVLLDSSISKHLVPNILTSYHSNVLPFIGSTGIGKTRTLIEMSKSTKHVNISYKYAAFPRLDGNTTLNSWPNSTAGMITWMTTVLEPFSRSQTVLKVVSVVLCEVLIVSIYDCQLTADNWLEYHDSIVSKCIKTWEKVKHLCIGSTGGLVSGFSIKKVTKFLCELKNDESEAILPSKNLVLLLDEVGSLITFSQVGFEQGWNLYRSLRHAARNVHWFRTSSEDKYSLLVVVSGTHTSLINFHHSPGRPDTFQYRPEEIRHYACCDVVTPAKTIPPFFVLPKQLDPVCFVEKKKMRSYEVTRH
ncbi:hypothetical protein GEMRC1_013601 [Eukaryota sp. GEM-RC1]